MVKVFHNFDDLADYKSDWIELADKQKLPMLSYDWFVESSSSFHKNDKLFLICVINKNRLNAVAPLYQDGGHVNSHYLQIIGGSNLYEPTSLLYRDHESLLQLISAFKCIGFPLLLSRIPRQIDFSNVYPNVSFQGIFHQLNNGVSQYLSIGNKFDEYESTLSSRRRYDLRRAHTKATELGEISYEINSPSVAKVNAMLEMAFQIENSGWKEQGGSSILKNIEMQQFFTRLFVKLAEHRQAIIGFVKIDNMPVSTVLAIQVYERLWILKTGYKEEFSICSPGVLLMHRMISYAYNKKLSGFEFLGSEERWIEMWKPEKHIYASYLYYPLSIKGIKGLLIDGFNLVKRKCG